MITSASWHTGIKEISVDTLAFVQEKVKLKLVHVMEMPYALNFSVIILLPCASHPVSVFYLFICFLNWKFHFFLMELVLYLVLFHEKFCSSYVKGL